MEKNKAISLLAHSFSSNKSVNWIVKGKTDKTKAIKHLMAYCYHNSIHSGKVFSNGHAVALCELHHTQKTALSQLRNQFRFLFNVAGTRVGKILKRSQYIKSYYPKDKPYLYIAFIGVDTTQQSKGQGTALLKDIEAYAREHNYPVYLETSNEKNLEFYNKNGYECYHTWQSELTGFTLWFFRKIVVNSAA